MLRNITCSLIPVTVVLASTGLVTTATAQPVRVESTEAPTAVTAGSDGLGQGLMISHNSACWLLTASHVAPRGADFFVWTEGQPGLQGNGVAMAPFWADMDLAIGVVRGAATRDCTLPLAALTDALELSGIGTYRLANVDDAGGLTYREMRISEVRDHKTFEAVFSDTDRAFQGRSGAFLFRGDQPVGMVRTQLGEGKHGFLRIQEIEMNVRRLLTARGDVFVSEALPVEAPQPAGFAVRVHGSDLRPAAIGETVESVIMGDQPFRYRGSGYIDLIVADESRQNLRGVRIDGAPDDGMPKSISMYTSPTVEGTPPMTWFANGTSDPAGVFDTGLRRDVPFRRLRIVLDGSWSGSVRRIDQITLY